MEIYPASQVFLQTAHPVRRMDTYALLDANREGSVSADEQPSLGLSSYKTR
jgi:hypothetical protein